MKKNEAIQVTTSRFWAVLILTLLLSVQGIKAQAWYNANWIYRTPVTIVNPVAVPLPGFQVKIDLLGGTSGNFDFALAAAGGADIRITDSDGITEIPFFIEIWDQVVDPDTADLWVRIPSLPVGESQIYVYYGYQGTPTPAAWTGDNVFDFYDGFDYEGAGGAATVPDITKWVLANGSWTQTVVDGGILTMTGLSTAFSRINGSAFFSDHYVGDSTGYIVETRARHPDETTNRIMEVGFASGAGTTFTECMRMTDNFTSTQYYQRHTQTGGNATKVDMITGPDPDQRWHRYGVYREESPLIAGFKIDDFVQETSDNITIEDVPPFLMSYARVGSNIFEVDWIWVRKWAGSDPVPAVEPRQDLNVWNGSLSTAWDDDGNWSATASPSSTHVVVINDEVNDPVISTTESCFRLTIEPGASLTVEALAGSLSVSDTIVINSTGTTLSGSLINYGTITGTAKYNRFLRPEDNRGERHFFSSPVGGMTVTEFIAANNNLLGLWEYNEVAGTWPDVTSLTLASGKGYNLAQTIGSTGRYSFIGSVVNQIDFNATSPYASGYAIREDADDYNPTDPLLWVSGRSWTNYGGGGWNLMGNPFTSALDAAAFVSENTGKFDPYYEALYVYDGINDVYRYATSTETGWEPVYGEGGSMGRYVQAGQGFFVLALYNAITFNFTPDMQAHQPSVPMLKSASVEDRWPGLKLKAKYGDRESSTIVMYNNEMTAGNDPGYDLGNLAGSAGVELYTAMVKGDINVNFARQALPVTGADKITVPVGVDTESGGEITFSAETQPLGTNRYWLHDKLTGIFTDLTTKSYTVTLPAQTYGTGRFFIVASVNTPTAIKLPDADMQGVRIWTADNRVIIKGDISDKATCEIFSLQGKLVVTCRLSNGDINTVDLPTGLQGVIVVKVTDGARTITRKVAML